LSTVNSKIYTPCTGSPGKGEEREESKGRENRAREVKEGKKKAWGGGEESRTMVKGEEGAEGS